MKKTIITAALLFAAGIAQASTICMEPRPASDSVQYVRIVDNDGKKHRFSLFILGEEDSVEFAQFIRSRKTAAMDPARDVYVKNADTAAVFRDVQDCKGKGKARKAMSL